MKEMGLIDNINIKELLPSTGFSDIELLHDDLDGLEVFNVASNELA